MLLLVCQNFTAISQIPNLVTVDLSDSPTSSFTVVDAQRLSGCFPCGTSIPYPSGGTPYAPGTDVCITFKLILHPMSTGVSIIFDGGATPTPATWGLNCGESTPINEVFCLDQSALTYYLTYCKPGSGSTNTIVFESLANPDIYYTGVCSEICPDIIYIGEGFLNYSINSTETDPTLKDTYESYLSCYPNCDNLVTSESGMVIIVPTGTFPDSVEYQIDGTLTTWDSPCVDEISNVQSFTIQLYDTMYYEKSPPGPFYTCCDVGETLDLKVENISGGLPFNDGSGDYYDIFWYDKPEGTGTLLQSDQGLSSTLEINSSGDYSAQIVDDNDNCDPVVINFNVNEEGILPVELLDFAAVCQPHETHLEWTCETEINNDFFTIEKSDDGVYFEHLAHIMGEGSSVTETNYQYTDYSTTNNNAFYRLTQTDFNGETNSLKVVSVNCQQVGEYKLSKNPIEDMLCIDFGNYNTTTNIQLIDQHGKVCFSRQGISQTQLNISCAYLKAGIYFLVIENENQISRTKIIKI